MPRPFAVIGFSFFLTLAVLSLLSDQIVYGLLVLSFLCSIITVFFERFRNPSVFSFATVTITTACLIFCLTNEFSYKPAISLAGKEVRFSGEIVEINQPDYGATRYLISTDQIDGKPLKMKIRLSTSDLLYAGLYDKVKAEATLYMLGGENQDSINFYKTTGVVIGAYVKTEPTLLPNNEKPVLYYLKMTRQALTDSLNQLLPNENGGLLTALLFGDKTYISDETVSDFKDIGVSHIMAVSGLHLSVFLFSFLFLIERIRLKKRVVSLLALFFILFFMSITGFSVSVLRAGFMLIVVQAGRVFNKEADSLNSLGLSVLLITAFSPFAAGNVGLQLSFFATLGIVTSHKHLKKHIVGMLKKIKTDNLRKPLLFISDTLIVTISASIFTLPVILISFGRFSLISLLSNILLLYFSTPAMILGALSAILFRLPLLCIFAYPLSMFAGLLAKLILAASRLLSNIPFSSIFIGDKYIFILFSITLLMIAYAVIAGKNIKRGYIGLTAVLSVFILSCGVVSNALINRNSVSISVMDIGNASSVSIAYNTHTALIACGGDRFTAKTIINGLKTINADSLDLLLIPRVAPTESGAAIDVLNIYDVKRTIVPEINNQLSFLSVISGSEVSRQTDTVLWNKVNLHYLFNDDLSCAYADISGTGVLFSFYPGSDLSKIPVEWMNSDILICRSKPPLNCEDLNFEVVIVSSEEPLPNSLVEAYKVNGIYLYETANIGNITIRTQGNSQYSLRRGD